MRRLSPNPRQVAARPDPLQVAIVKMARLVEEDCWTEEQRSRNWPYAEVKGLARLGDRVRDILAEYCLRYGDWASQVFMSTEKFFDGRMPPATSDPTHAPAPSAPLTDRPDGQLYVAYPIRDWIKPFAQKAAMVHIDLVRSAADEPVWGGDIDNVAGPVPSSDFGDDMGTEYSPAETQSDIEIKASMYFGEHTDLAMFCDNIFRVPLLDPYGQYRERVEEAARWFLVPPGAVVHSACCFCHWSLVHVSQLSKTSWRRMVAMAWVTARDLVPDPHAGTLSNLRLTADDYAPFVATAVMMTRLGYTIPNALATLGVHSIETANVKRIIGKLRLEVIEARKLGPLAPGVLALALPPRFRPLPVLL
jgi:hypothetical protein